MTTVTDILYVMLCSDFSSGQSCQFLQHRHRSAIGLRWKSFNQIHCKGPLICYDVLGNDSFLDLHLKAGSYEGLVVLADLN